MNWLMNMKEVYIKEKYMRMLAYILAMIAGFVSAIIAIKLGYKPLVSWQYWSIFGVSMIPSILLNFYIDFIRR